MRVYVCVNGKLIRIQRTLSSNHRMHYSIFPCAVCIDEFYVSFAEIYMKNSACIPATMQRTPCRLSLLLLFLLMCACVSVHVCVCARLHDCVCEKSVIVACWSRNFPLICSRNPSIAILQ